METELAIRCIHHIYNMYLQILLYIYTIHIYMRERKENCAPPTYILLKYIVIIYYNYTRNIHDKEIELN